MKRLQMSQKLVYRKFWVHKKKLRTQNCRSKFMKNTKKTCTPNNRNLDRHENTSFAFKFKILTS